MGLLGDSWEDPRTMAALMLGGGLLSGGNLAQGIAGYQGVLNDDADRKLKRADLAARTEDTRQQVALRQAQLQEIAMRQKMMQGLDGPPGPGAVVPASQGQLGSGTMGILPTTGGAPVIPQGAPAI